MKADQLYLFKEAKSHKSHTRMAGKVRVRGHRRCNGSYVKEHWRSRPIRPIRGVGTSRGFNTAEKQLAFFEDSEASD